MNNTEVSIQSVGNEIPVIINSQAITLEELQNSKAGEVSEVQSIPVVDDTLNVDLISDETEVLEEINVTEKNPSENIIIEEPRKINAEETIFDYFKYLDDFYKA